MGVLALYTVIDPGLISLNFGALPSHCPNEWQRNSRISLLSRDGSYFAFAFLFLNHADNRCFVTPLTLLVNLTASATQVCLVNFNDAGERLITLLHHKSDLPTHAPGGLISNTKRAFKFLAADAVSTDAEHIHGVEPFFKRCF